MVAPAGVNEGLPQEPAKAGGPGVELTETQVAGATPGGDSAETAAAEPSLEKPALAAAGRAEAEPAERVPRKPSPPRRVPRKPSPPKRVPRKPSPGPAQGGRAGRGGRGR